MASKLQLSKLRPVAVAAAAAVLLVAAACHKAAEDVYVREFQKGVAYTGYWGTAYDGDGPLLALARLEDTNATWVSVLVTAYQETIHTTSIDFAGPATPTDAAVERIIRRAHDLGLKVMLKPHVDLSDDPAHYRGEIGPDFTPADWGAWFDSYRSFILHYADMAQRTGCELFCVGCELGTTAVYEGPWREIVAVIRDLYLGPLTYADNQVEYNLDAVGWWDAVDFIGQDAYPTLTQVVSPTVDDLLAGWISFRARLQQLAERWGKPLILTEIGCRSILGGAQNPWDWQRQGPVDLTVQANFYEAACQAVEGRSWLRGMYWWQWSPDPDDGGPNDTGYTPHGKPAEDALRSWYLRLD
jgi:Glycoside Hydrolase Family 113